MMRIGSIERYLEEKDANEFTLRINQPNQIYDDEVNSSCVINVTDAGKNNIVRVSKTLKYNPILTINGDNNLIYIGKGCKLLGLRLKVVGDNNFVYIGDKVTTNGDNRFFVGIGVAGGCTGLIVNEDVMFANNVTLRNSDAHPVFDSCTLEALNNPSGPIIIGRHTWVGESSKILKGVEIPACSIISAGALVHRSPDAPSIVFGNPAKTKPIGSRVWARDHSDTAIKSALKYYS